MEKFRYNKNLSFEKWQQNNIAYDLFADLLVWFLTFAVVDTIRRMIGFKGTGFTGTEDFFSVKGLIDSVIFGIVLFLCGLLKKKIILLYQVAKDKQIKKV